VNFVAHGHTELISENLSHIIYGILRKVSIMLWSATTTQYKQLDLVNFVEHGHTELISENLSHIIYGILRKVSIMLS